MCSIMLLRLQESCKTCAILWDVLLFYYKWANHLRLWHRPLCSAASVTCTCCTVLSWWWYSSDVMICGDVYQPPSRAIIRPTSMYITMIYKAPTNWKPVQLRLQWCYVIILWRSSHLDEKWSVLRGDDRSIVTRTPLLAFSSCSDRYQRRQIRL